MTIRTELRLHQELLLLALRDETGTVAVGSMYQYALGGALLAELLFETRVVIQEEKKKKFVKAVRFTSTGDDVLDECLAKVRAAKRRATVQTWVSRFARIKHLKHRVAAQLCRRGIVKADEDTVLVLFRRKVYPEINPMPERQMIERLRRAVFGDSLDVEPRTLVLVSLAHSTGLLKVPFGGRALKSRKARLEQLTKGELLGKAAKEVAEAAQAALVIAAVVPSVIVATTSAGH